MGPATDKHQASLFKHAKCSADHFFLLFDHTVKPVLMYGTEAVVF